MYFFPIALVLFLGRFNSSLLGYEFLNTDEFAIGAKALRFIINDFNFYQFDGDTSGLLNALFLIWPNILNLDITYLSIRLSAIFALSFILLFSLKTISLYHDKKISFVIFLPLLLFFTFTKDPDFLHYTNELIATLLITILLYLLFLKAGKLNFKNAFLISAIAGCVLFAKMQFFPVALILIFLEILRQYFKYKNIKNCISIICGLIFPSILISIYYLINNEFIDLFYNVIHYPLSDLVARNLSDDMIIVESNNLIAITSSNKLGILFNHLILNSVFHLSYIYFLTFLILFFLSKKKLELISFEQIIIIFAIISSLAISLVTGSVHRHYLIVTIPMLPIFISIFSKDFDSKIFFNKKSIKLLSIIFISVLVISLSLENQKFYSKKFYASNIKDNKFNFYSPKLLEYLKLKDDSKMVAWGWNPEIYLLSNYSPATRETINQKQIDYKSNREYFRNRFINDFKKNNPNLFIDYVKPRGYMFTDVKRNGVESFPKLKSILSNNFEKLKNTNINCPDTYLTKNSYDRLQKKLVEFVVKSNKKELTELNDFGIDEKICNTSIIFNTNYSDTLSLEINKNYLSEIMILASKANRFENKINLKFHLINDQVKQKSFILKKYPFWSKIKINEELQIDKIEIDVQNLIKNNLGINEIKLFKY